MLSDKERIKRLEEKTDALTEAKNKLERQMEIRTEIERFVGEQEKGIFKYTKDVFKVSVILLAFYTGGNKALEAQWIQDLLK